MAIVKLGPLVVGIRGTIGGITLSANASGPHARIWSKGVNPKSSQQLATRSRITGLGTLWSSLSDLDRAAWTAFALAPPETDYNSLGEIIYLTGWQWFVRVNQRRQAIGLATTTTLPTNSAVTPIATTTITADSSPVPSITVTWTAGDFPAGYAASGFLAPHTSTGLQTKSTGFTQLLAQVAPAGTSADLADAYTSRLGNLNAGWKLFWRIYRVRVDGVRSIATEATCEVS